MNHVSTVHDMARDILAAAGPALSPGSPGDAGPAILVGLVARDRCVEDDLAARSLAAWLATYRHGVTHLGLVGLGLAGFVAGAWSAARAHPRLAGLAARGRDHLIATAPTGQPGPTVAWSDYDLLHGPSGVLLSLASAPDRRAEHLLPMATRLAGYCGGDDLARARVTEVTHPRGGWNVGRVNLGLAHGLPGVVCALRATVEVAGPRPDLTDALRRAVRFLVDESHVDDRGVLTWWSGSREGGPVPTAASHRQAWCYGTPGVAWALWEAGRVLADTDTMDVALTAMTSLCRAWDDEFYVDFGAPSDSLGFCHGLAGLLMVAGAFEEHAGLAQAAALRARVRDLILARLDQVRALAEHDMSHLSGASGVLAALLTDQGGERSWLVPYALR